VFYDVAHMNHIERLWRKVRLQSQEKIVVKISLMHEEPFGVGLGDGRWIGFNPDSPPTSLSCDFEKGSDIRADVQNATRRYQPLDSLQRVTKILLIYVGSSRIVANWRSFVVCVL
jgi:hypothetical protein